MSISLYWRLGMLCQTVWLSNITVICFELRAWIINEIVSVLHVQHSRHTILLIMQGGLIVSFSRTIHVENKITTCSCRFLIACILGARKSSNWYNQKFIYSESRTFAHQNDKTKRNYKEESAIWAICTSPFASSFLLLFLWVRFTFFFFLAMVGGGGGGRGVRFVFFLRQR